MRNSIERLIEKAESAALGWARHAAGKTLGGATLGRLESLLAKVRLCIEEVQVAMQALQRARILRDQALEELRDLLGWMKRGILADPELGPDSFLLKSLGCKPSSEYKSGLTRKKKEREPGEKAESVDPGKRRSKFR